DKNKKPIRVGGRRPPGFTPFR
uniref:Protopolybiakinin-1 n=1 Tax=Protopolybia exigua TaxID=91439 RepID=BRK1_PROEX|nr:RecName: Full=Protopolybiakinin-1; AltName: Full=Bradykinin-related peptide; AltName: Full=Protopolybiakinin-I [Protopolybia exigua]